MKICMIGLGSIGKRHLENLLMLLEKRNIEHHIDALRSNRTSLPEKLNDIINEQYYSINDLPDDYDIIFITNPTSLHYDIISNTIKKTKHMFIEKPVFDSIKYDINSLTLKEDSIYYVACPMRHKRIIKHVKNNILENETVISVRVISTSYLPQWRVGVDYRNIYSSKNSLGGGVTKDLIHEWDYVIDLFGNPDKVYNIKGHMSDLEIDSDDISVYIVKYPKMILEMHLDYVGHKTERILQLFTNNKRIDVDFISNIINEYENNELINTIEFPSEDFYKTEMEYFLDCIDKRKNNINTIENAYNTLKIAMAEG